MFLDGKDSDGGFSKLPNMEFGTTKKEMALECRALALTILEASGVWQFFIRIFTAIFKYSI